MRPAEPAAGEVPFREGERVLLVDRRGRRYLVRLRQHGSFQTHAGVVEHDAVIGQLEGSEIRASRGGDGTRSPRRFLAFRPTLADVVLKMPRGAQVIYPKDLAAILLAADLYPGARVLEAGVGSGALSMAALRAGCTVTGYEIRADFAERAIANVHEMFGDDVDFAVEVRDIYEGIDGSGFDRILLDLPEPWRVVHHATGALVPGGIFLAYLPTINQTSTLRDRIAHAPFACAETFEVLRRTWHLDGRSVRPDHRMVAHTGFITTARRLVGDGATWAEGDALEEESRG